MDRLGRDGPRCLGRRPGGVLVLSADEGLAVLLRARTVTAMAFGDQERRPLVLILLVIIPAYVITRSVAETLPTPRQIGLPGGL